MTQTNKRENSLMSDIKELSKESHVWEGKHESK